MTERQEESRNVIREVASLTVSETVDGTSRRRGRGPDKRERNQIEHIVVDPEVMAVAKRIMRPGQRLVIIDATTVRLVNKR